MVEKYSDLAIIIRVVSSGEADKIVNLVSEKHGFITLFARGARRISSRKSAHLDSLNLIRFNASIKNNYQYVDQVESVSCFQSIKSNFEKTKVSLTITEILNNTLPVDVEDREIFLSLKSFLYGLEEAKNTKDINHLSRRFGLFLLRHLGFPLPKSPQIDSLSSYFETIMNRRIISKDIK